MYFLFGLFSFAAYLFYEEGACEHSGGFAEMERRLYLEPNRRCQLVFDCFSSIIPNATATAAHCRFFLTWNSKIQLYFGD
ncbi:hypothetical protein BJ138DRAFT_1148946 [Hygrophoropsis aurantiaca]|uniref:Uncharacterized protein n=1 Tax=Hygrophoropsis aurantiaca TaxID=72124 RepID=A0ACB8AGT4_9AGAM|nr:hypothetical protein BJ138DRAFT_1148946 [Hygrophoropsis aurantiaca]